MHPTGMIIIWAGAIVDIPSGWVICDGTLGTPDLRDRFVVGAGSTYAVDAIGGSNDHNHLFTGPGHSHNFSAGVGIQSGVGIDSATDGTVVVGNTDMEDNIPPYHALAYIMKT